MASITELSSLHAEHDRVMDEYRRVGMPLLERVAELSGKIRDIRREAGDLFYVEYMRYHAPYTEECDDLADAKSFARDSEDAGDAYVKRIHGPGVDLRKHEWNE